MELDPVRLRILKLIGDRGTDLKNVSLAIGRNHAYLYQFVHKGTPRALPDDVRGALAEHFGCDESELQLDGVPASKPRARRVTRPSADQLEFPAHVVPIPEIDVRASAGPGAINEGLEEARDIWYLSARMIRHELRAKPEDLRMITIDGDSMEPLLASGDRILVDTSQKVPVPPGIFVIWDGMGLVAKRVEHEPNSDPPKVRIDSVNPSYQSYERTADEVSVVGRVVWTARRL